MTRVLVSVRSIEEALLAAEAAVDLIDLKEPHAGALGGLPPLLVSQIVGALRRHGCKQPISATIGDWPMEALATILDRVDTMASCGVDYVKVGIENTAAAAGALAALALCGHPVVPVFIADRGVDLGQVRQACQGPFPALMLDTADKLSGSLFDCLGEDMLRRFVATCQAAGKPCGLAGALRPSHLERVRELAPDFAGFRSAVCSGSRTDALDPARLQALRQELRLAQAPVQAG